MNKKDLIGNSYKLANGVVFKALGVEVYSAKKVSKKYEQILAIKHSHLVAINYRGTLIPNITFENGVVRLTSVEIGGKIFSRPSAISEALGVVKAMEAQLLKKIG